MGAVRDWGVEGRPRLVWPQAALSVSWYPGASGWLAGGRDLPWGLSVKAAEDLLGLSGTPKHEV